jgi:transglutaminase-like putative cysteine protease
MITKGLVLQKRCPWVYALIPHTAALFILFWQLRLLASDLADTPVFAAALLGAFAAAFFLYLKKRRPLPALCVIALIPWTIRLFIALPRWFVSGAEAELVFDSLLLNLDRNSFVSLLPFYWIAVGSYFSLRSRLFLRGNIIAADTLFLVLFSIAPTASMKAYRWPVLMIAVFALILFLQILTLILSVPPEFKLKKREGAAAAFALFLLVILGGALFIGPSQEKAVEQGGGLLEPKLFQLDISQYLRLEPEISVNDDLVLIMKKDTYDEHILVRRYTLSGYDKKQGFYRHETIDEEAHPQRLPDRPTRLPAQDRIKDFVVANQEYYLVNFDSSAFIGLNMPVELIPFETWDASSFSSAYGVQSYTSTAMPFELIDVVREAPSAEILGMTREDYSFYTEYGGDEEIAAAAREITAGLRPYWEQTQAVYDYLKYGAFRYSLKPGIAAGGDQLKHFLFTAKKGYCSYYAFAFTLLLRSLGIPCRVAVGFLIDPRVEVFDYYPVRADMVHAWAEVWYPGYGWIEYDATTEQLAAGEEFRFSPGTPPEIFERLIKEILDNHSRLRPKEGEDEKNRGRDLAALGRETLSLIQKRGLVLVLAILILAFLMTRCLFLLFSLLRRNPRKKAFFLWAHVRRRLALGGIKKPADLGEAEWAGALDGRLSGLYALYQDYAAARFAPVHSYSYDNSALAAMKTNYRRFSLSYRAVIPAGRRILAWVLPPAALALPPPADGRPSDKDPGSAGRAPAFFLIVSVLLSLGGDRSAAQNPDPQADALYQNAWDAQLAENWELAVELYTQGSGLYPGDRRFPLALGNLYFYRQLYRLAWDEYRRAEKLTPWEPDLLFQLSRTAGYLNEDAVSVEYLEKFLDRIPDDKEAIGNLGWMYYKIHRLEDGRRLLLEAQERMGTDSEFAMTLGTIYSDMFVYDEAKKWYLDAIAGAESARKYNFAAVAHYNLSILESRFYQFNLAYERSAASLDAEDRASGRLAQGELYLRRMELNQALEACQKAYEMDTSPLSKVNLAQVFQTGGRLEEARLYAEDCLKAGDQSWMLNYGIDPVRYKRDLHEILTDIYKGLEKTESFTARSGFSEKFLSLARKVSFRFRAAVHQHLFRKYSLLSANAYQTGDKGAGSLRHEPPGAGEIHLDALLQYYYAFQPYPRRALSYLRKARDFEEPLIPPSAPSYDLEEGSLVKNTGLIRQALEAFNSRWERDMIAKAYVELARKGGREDRADAAERLFAINRGGLRQKGIKLPADITINGTNPRTAAALRRAAISAGIEPEGNRAPRYTLILGAEQSGILCELYDEGRGVSVFRRNIPLKSLSGQDRAAFSRALGDAIFNGW